MYKSFDKKDPFYKALVLIFMNLSKHQIKILIAGCISALLVFVVGLSLVQCARHRSVPLTEPVRAELEQFPPNTHMPAFREGLVSGSIDLKSFSPDKDLIQIDDTRVWWESDNDENDDEDDHIIHKSLEVPLRRLIELVCHAGGRLEVHDAYRPSGIHNPGSLHKEGRAIDVTCDEFPLERLAKLCWAAGFDWVYYEAKGRSGAHIHCSVRR